MRRAGQLLGRISAPTGCIFLKFRISDWIFILYNLHICL